MGNPRVPDFKNSAGYYQQFKLETKMTQRLKMKEMIPDK